MVHFSNKQEGPDLLSQRKPMSVWELVKQARSTLEQNYGFVRVVGEISNYSKAQSGHAYFNLKDDRASLPAVMFRNALSRCAKIGFPADGCQVECIGRLTLYEPRGRTQLVLEWMVEQGEGALGLRFEELKQRLLAEGLFDQSRKRTLPFWPTSIGIITSPTGAALRDILHVLQKNKPAVKVLIYPVEVQGQTASQQIAQAIDFMACESDCQVVIVGRGGGSAEDLWAFNEEPVVYAISRSSVPIISAVGHEVDIVLSDLAADVRAPTPTAAAQMVLPDRQELQQRLATSSSRLHQALLLRLSRARSQLQELCARMSDPRLLVASGHMRLDDLQRRLQRSVTTRLKHDLAHLTQLRLRLAAQKPAYILSENRKRLDLMVQRLVQSIENRLERSRSRLDSNRKLLAGLSPLSILDRGYALLFDPAGQLVKSVDSLSVGQSLWIRLRDGLVSVRLEDTSKTTDDVPWQ